MRDIENYTKNYSKPGFEHILIEYRRKKILTIIESIKPGKILEIGCGLHPIFEFWGNFDSYIYFESSKQFFDNAEKIKMNNKRIVGYNLPFSCIDEIKDYSPDLILCSSLLHELENPKKMLSDIYEVSSSATITHINVPNANSFHRLLAQSMHLISNTKEMSERNLFYSKTVFMI